MRGRSQQECRLVKYNRNSETWRPSDCSNCPIPPILDNNHNPNLVLEGTITQGLLGIGRKMTVKAVCSKHLIDIPKPKSGCPKCSQEQPNISDLFTDM